MKYISYLSGIVLAGLLSASPIHAQDQSGQESNADQQSAEERRAEARASLQELLQEVEQAVRNERQINQERERAFIQQRNQRQQMLQQARAELQAAKQRSDELQASYDENEERLVELNTQLEERQGNLGEMFGVVRTTSSEFAANLEDSITSSQFPDRTEFLYNLAERKELATVPELRRLWLEMVREVSAQGETASYTAPVLRGDGQVAEGQQVVRVGVFNAIAGGKYLQWNKGIGDNEGTLGVVTPQPEDKFTSTAQALQNASAGEIVSFGVDTTRGAILKLVVRAPSRIEQVQQGGVVGYVILVLGAIGLLVAIWRGIILFFKGGAMKRQLKKEKADSKNALGRVMKVYEDNPHADVETLELKLDEAILRETAPIERGLGFIKIIYVVAPLLGLLGTVTGMIETFQQITLFGTGDPQMMAGGISMALITTVLGLVVAIPMTVIHSLLQGRANTLIQILEEQSAGIVAKLAEKRDAKPARNA